MVEATAVTPASPFLMRSMSEAGRSSRQADEYVKSWSSIFFRIYLKRHLAMRTPVPGCASSATANVKRCPASVKAGRDANWHGAHTTLDPELRQVGDRVIEPAEDSAV